MRQLHISDQLAFQASLLDHIRSAVIATDVSGTILYWNSFAEALYQWNAPEVLQKSIAEVVSFQQWGIRPSQLVKQVLRTGVWRGEILLQRRDRSSFWAEVVVSAIQNADQPVTGFLAVANDITDIYLIRQAERMQAALESAHLLNEIASRIRQSLDLNQILNQAVSEVRQLLDIERVTIYRIEPENSGSFVVESVSDQRYSVLGMVLHDPCFGDHYIQQYQQGRVSVIDDIDQADLLPCYRELLERTSIRANLLVPIVFHEKLWGLLAAQQCSAPRIWKESEVSLLQQLATQLAIAIQQSELYGQIQYLNSDLEQQVQERTVQLQQALDFEARVKRITDKVRDSLDEMQILETAVQELAIGLKIDCCDAALYNLQERTATVAYEYTNSIPAGQGNVWPMSSLPEVYQQLLRGEDFQLCFLDHPVRGQVSVFACPIFDDQGVLGDLWLFNPSGYAFQDSEQRLARQVATQCAIALRQARLYQAAQDQVESLEKLNQLKDDFLSTVSHELRTPISNMKMAIYMLKAAPTPERRERYLEILETECKREAELVNDLLDLQSLEAASYPVFMVEAVDLQEWIPSLLEPFYSRFQSHQQHLIVHLPPQLPPLLSDRASVGRILVELLNNACKYTPAQGEIHFRLHYEAEPNRANPANLPQLKFVIQNQVEIPSTALPHIFDKFYRVPNADPWKQGGTGLGLALVQRLAERLKGTIRVESTQGWTTFTLQLPVQPGTEGMASPIQ